MEKVYETGDMLLIYRLDGVPSWRIVPAANKDSVKEKENCVPEPLVQFKLAGDGYGNHFLHGQSMKYGQSIENLTYLSQKSENAGGQLTVETLLKDRRGNRLCHVAISDGVTVRVHTVFENTTADEEKLEMLSSFTLGGLTPFDEGEASRKLCLHRMQSCWSAEGRLESRPIEAYQLEPSWSGYGARVLRFGQIGSMPVRGYFPFAAIEDTEADVMWGVQLAVASSWQMEVTRLDNGLSLSGGIADREFGHWMKLLRPGERFVTPEAILSVSKGDIDTLCTRLVHAQEVKEETYDSAHMPVIFNEFCTTWGDPSIGNITRIAERLRGSGVGYFVIDAGWDKTDQGQWDSAIGDWVYNRKLFPNSPKEAADVIRANGMIPGIWFEMENVGRQAKAFSMLDHLLKRDGYPITAGERRFWDMQDPWVRTYLGEKVIEFLKDNGFGYLKVDYNDNIGIGCDGAESFGEALRQKVLASQEFFRDIRRAIPGIVIENCSSGGHRLEPSMMGLADMASFSDAHECIQIPVIAANVLRAVPAWKSQIWAVLRRTDDSRRLYYSLANTFLGRMCLSGDIFDMDEKQWGIVLEGIAFYKKSAQVIRRGRIRRYGGAVASYNHPAGWQGITMKRNNQTMAVFHAFADAPEAVELPVRGKITGFFGENPACVRADGNKLKISGMPAFSACVVLAEE